MEVTPSLACANKCVFCVAEGTLISMSDGLSRPIEQLIGQQNILAARTESVTDVDRGVYNGQSIELLDQGTNVLVLFCTLTQYCCRVETSHPYATKCSKTYSTRLDSTVLYCTHSRHHVAY
jgi:hypothetical protein